ncbi:MAG: indolepyruvate oxidoreductase subunit beta [Chlorobi bacterium]|nr:indolepyruvate oxidoreductase subunit beta [Chlorobiota bacterium]
MKTDIVLAGVGGQGILSIAATIGMAATKDNLNIKQAEVHGMSQRGGAVLSHMRISEKEIASDLIPEGYADLILSVEPMESLRYLPFLNANGWIVANSTPYINIPDYPDIKRILGEIEQHANHILIDADHIAKEIGSPKSSNIVMLGAASPFINIPFESFLEGIKLIFGKKGDKVVNDNIAALHAGKSFSEKHSVKN